MKVTKFFKFGIASLCLATAMMSACKHVEPTKPNNPTYDEGVIINGVKWATRNVDAVGTFAPTPESAGMLYQWNRNIGWNGTDSLLSSADSIIWFTDWEGRADTVWTANICPAGWRVPTFDEINTLLDIVEKVDSKWKTQNGVDGWLFADKATNNTLFMPAAGRRNKSGNFSHKYSGYWACTIETNENAQGLYFYYDTQLGTNVCIPVQSNKSYGFSVRCVAE